ncbi:MAG: UpxY family transcription antiterminator [Acidobacteriota bacterium]
MSVAWFAVRTRTRAEKVVREHLEARAIEAFLPTVNKWSRWKDRKKEVEWPLFPGYCFAHFAASDQLVVRTSPGVADIVSFAGSLAAIPDHEVESLRTLMQSQVKYDPAPHIKEGTMAEVTHGPLKGVIGRLVRKGDHARLILSVDLIGKGVSVEVDAADVRPI